VTGSERFDIGDTVPDFSLPDSANVPRSLSRLAASDRAVLLFYRGEW